MYLLFLLLIQNQTITFQPYETGTVVEFGSFTVTVPEGVYLASETDAEYMFDLTGATMIPDCSGIFFSKDEDWSFCGILQFYPYQTFSFEPMPPPDYFTRAFQAMNMYYLTPANGAARTVIEPSLNESEGSFVIGMEYTEPVGKTGVFIKKIWTNPQDTLVLTIKVEDLNSYEKNLAAIDGMLDSVIPAQTELEALPLEPASFLHPLGLINRAALKEDSLTLSVFLTSLGLLLLGVALLVLALRLRRKTPSKSDPANEESDQQIEQMDESERPEHIQP